MTTGWPLGIATLIAWLLTASIGVYMLRTWIARGGLRRQRTTGVGVPPAVVFGHAGAALTGLAIWVGYLGSRSDALAWIGVVLISTAITLGVCTVTLWTPYPIQAGPGPAEETPLARAGGVARPVRPDAARGTAADGPQAPSAGSPRAPSAGSPRAPSAGSPRAPSAGSPRAPWAGSPRARGPRTGPSEHPDAFTVTDEMIASLLAEPVRVRPRRRPQLLPLIPVSHGFAALTTFMLALLTAISARLGEPGPAGSRHPDWAIGLPVRQAGIMAETLTMMAVHAHPDDEASSTGGVLAAYSAQGIRTVVVTCTNGEFGDADGGVKPGQDGHDEKEVARQRLAELRESCAILGVTNLELLGYHDSGMPDWDYKDRPDAFCNIPQADVAARISGLIERYRPQVLITYDDQGAYQHPDHVHASLCAQAAFADSGIPAKLYLAAMRGSDWQKLWDALRELGADVPDFQEVDPEIMRRGVISEQRITTTVDIRPVLAQKRDALFAHGSQMSDSWFSKLPQEIAEATFGREHFIRAADKTGAPLPEDDLFAGLRGFRGSGQ